MAACLFRWQNVVNMIHVVELKRSLVASPGLRYVEECVLNSFIPRLCCMYFISVLLSGVFNVLSSSAITITLAVYIFIYIHTHVLKSTPPRLITNTELFRSQIKV